MATTRTKVELDMLRVEAERMVRAGESRADVARTLDVSPQTLAAWALKYRWRQIDLEAERAGELAQAAADKIGAMRGGAAAEADAAPEAPFEEEAEEVDPGEAARRSMGRANSLIRQGRVVEADRTLRLAERFLVAQARMDRHAQRMGEGGAAAAPGELRRDETEAQFRARQADGDKEREHICQTLDRMIVEARAADQAAWDEILAGGVCPACRAPLAPDAVDQTPSHDMDLETGTLIRTW